MLNARMKHILRELMAMESPITGDYLATINQVTARTTRNDVKNLNAIISEHGAQVHTIMGKGYQLEMNDDQKFRYFLRGIFNEEVSDDSLVPSLPEERTAYLIKRFLDRKSVV